LNMNTRRRYVMARGLKVGLYHQLNFTEEQSFEITSNYEDAMILYMTFN